MNEHLAHDKIFLSKLTEITLANLGNENFGVNELANKMGVSHHILRRRLHVITNKTINQFIRETRLQKALEMLQNGNVTSSDVAYKVGFSSPAYFNTCFSEFFGYPPGQVKRTTTNNAKEINSIQVKSKHEQKRSSRRTFIYISSGILLLAVIVFLIYSIFLKHSTPHAGNNIVKDVDGNIYHTVTIGTQVWMAENLRTTRYNDGKKIPMVSDNTTWESQTAPARCWYNNDSINYARSYGAIYNYYAVDIGSNGGRNVCPDGWHVPNASDWNRLFTYLGGEYFAGGKLKDTGTTHWVAPNYGATNETGFTALPSGGRDYSGRFYGMGEYNGWWSSPESGAFRSLASDRVWVYVAQCPQNQGFSIRCIKDN